VPLYQVIVLALVQALTEFLPISSSAHLSILPRIFGWKEAGLTFDVALHAGTLIAVFFYFWKDLWQVVLGALRIKEPTDPDLRAQPNLMWMIGLATLPTVIAGLLLKDKVESTFRDPFLTAVTLIGFGLLMGWADLRSRNGEQRSLGTITWTDAIVIGLCQAVAIVPGTSRSGVTITAALLLGLSRYSGARFSFLLSTPAVFGAALLAFKDQYEAGGISEEMKLPFIVGIAVSALAGGLVIRNLMEFLKKFSLQGFVAYRVVFGILIVALAVLYRR
jgi:undecaprenyl-diphosphatase